MKAAPVAVAALAAAVTLGSLCNGFVYDDVLVILQNPLVHGLSRSGAIWHSSYWPAGLLYRPLTIQGFAAEWAAGSGSPLFFHAVSIALAIVTALLVLRLALRILPPLPAAAAAAVFAVHPVHVEAVANVVGQSELLATLCALLAVERYLAWRAEGELPLARRLTLAGLTLLAILAKETGYVIPLLLAAAELTLVRQRRTRIAGIFLLQGSVVVSALLLRLIVLGSLAGEHPSAVFRGLSLPGRALAMLAVVPEWTRLLLWPAQLQAEYGPPAIPITASLGAAQLGGLGILAVIVALLVWSWKRAPVVAFGLLWVLLALAPVSNVIAPSGLVLAERVLFLPSVGAALLLGAALAALLPRLNSAPRQVRVAAAAAGVVLLALAGVRAASRNAAWHSQEEFFTRLQRDAPRTYRAHFVSARYYYGERRFPEAERAARRALTLYPLDPQVHEQLGQVLRVEGRCGEALPVLELGVQLAPDGTTLRSRLIECALAVGDTALARASASEAVRLGQAEFRSTLERLTAH